jgi:hypothetical protein|tara:strand:- start:1579 stop:1869 length:291 start_codon:yes stop_codon:yes gene_type:complete
MLSFQNRKQTTVALAQKESTRSIFQLQLAFDDPECALLTSLFNEAFLVVTVKKCLTSLFPTERDFFKNNNKIKSFEKDHDDHRGKATLGSVVLPFR